MSNIEQSIDVHVPVHTAYNQWTQFEEFPRFMEGVEEIRQLDDKRLHWRANVGGKTKEWDAVITEQVPDERIAWRNTTGTTNAGVVTFHRISDGTTRIMLQLDYDPEGIVENVGDMVGVVSSRVRGDLERFKQFIEQRGQETGAWRGTIEQPDKQGGSGMKEANEQRNQGQHGAAASTSSAASSGSTGQQHGRAGEQEHGRNVQGAQSGSAKPQSQSGMAAGGSQKGSSSGQMATTHDGGQRQPQRQRSQGLMSRGWFDSPLWMENPFNMMRRFSEEMDRLFDEFRLGRGPQSYQHGGGRGGVSSWSPQIEMYQKDNQLVICTDLPGMRQEDIQLEVNEDVLTIQGERRNEFEDNQEGYYRSERSYGSFSRSIPLPEGVDAEQAKASFENGVLKVMFPLPQQQQQRKRRIEVGGGTTQGSSSASQGGSGSSSANR